MAVSITSISQSEPFLKEEVTVTGSGFGSAGNNSVVVNSTSATITSDTTTSVSFIVPSSLTEGSTYTITVTNTTDGTSGTINITIASEPPDKEKKYIALVFGEYTSLSYQTNKSGIPYTNRFGDSATGGTFDVLFNICNPDLNTFTCQTSSGAGQWGHTKILEGRNDERAVTFKDFRWATANSGNTKEQPKYVYTLPTTLSLTLSKSTFAPGDKVKLTGGGITPESTIEINTTSATIDLISYEYLEFTVPSLSDGTYTLTYTNKAGKTWTSSVTVSSIVPPKEEKELKVIPVEAGLTGSITSVDVETSSPNTDIPISIKVKGDVQIQTRVYLKVVITDPMGNTWSDTTSEVDIDAGDTQKFTVTYPASETSNIGTYEAVVTMTSELWVGNETSPRETTEVDEETVKFQVSDKPIILRQKTIDSLPDSFKLGLKREFSIFCKNLGSKTYTLSSKMRIIHDDLVTGITIAAGACSVTSGEYCNVDGSDLVNYDYFEIPSTKVKVSAGSEHEFKMSWTPDRKTKLGDYYLCADLCCDEC